MADSNPQSRLLRREDTVRAYTSIEVRMQALQDLGSHLLASARDLKRVILNGDATADDLLELKQDKEETNGLD